MREEEVNLSTNQNNARELQREIILISSCSRQNVDKIKENVKNYFYLRHLFTSCLCELLEPKGVIMLHHRSLSVVSDS